VGAVQAVGKLTAEGNHRPSFRPNQVATVFHSHLLQNKVCECYEPATHAAVRPHITVSFNDNTQVQALYDTGASPNCMHPDIFQKCKKLNLVQAIIKTINITTANGQTCAAKLAKITLTVGGRTRTSNFAVVPDCSSPIILGMRGIHDWQVDYLASQDCFQFANSKTYRSNVASIRPSKMQSIEPHKQAIVSLTLRDLVTDRPMPDTEVIASVLGTDILAHTDSNGKIHVRVSNPSNALITFERQTDMGTAEVMLSEYHISRVQEDNVTSAFVSPQVASASTQTDSKDKNKTSSFADMVHNAIAHLPKDVQRDLRRVLNDNQSCISKHKFDLGLTDLHQHTIHMKDQQPVYHKQFPIPVTHADIINDHVQQWLRMGIVEPAQSPYNSPIFCVKKKDGSFRLCLDYRGVNEKSMPTNYSIRTPEDCISELGQHGGKHFIALDLSSGFYQMPLAKSSRHITAFTVPKHGQLQWTRGAMGLKGCPGSFARLMDMALKGIPNVLIYIDDVLIYGRTPQEAIKTLQMVLQRLIKHNLKINLSKSVFLQPRTHYLGYTLTASGIFPGEDKAKAIAQAKPPASVKQLKSFLGMTNYFRNFIKHFARQAGRLYALTRADSTWKGGPLPQDALQTFKTLQRLIAQASPRAFPLKNGRYHLFTDASLGDDTDKGGLGAHLMQEDEQGELQTIAFASRGLKLHEENYSAFLLELQAAVWAIDHFSHYLRGRTFILYTDHAPLTKLSKVHTKTLHRLHALLNEYHFEMRHIKGKHNAVADFLSRSHGPAAIAAVAGMDTLQIAQLEDAVLGPIYRALNHNKEPQWPSDLKRYTRYISIKHGILVIQLPPRDGFLDDNRARALVPSALRQALLKEAHNSALGGHQGIFKTLERIKQTFWWPSMDVDVAKHTKHCLTCQATSNKDVPKPLPHQEYPQTRAPNERIHADLFGPVHNQLHQSCYILGITDSFTKVTRLTVVDNKEAKTVARALWKDWFAIYGIPKLIITDQGNEFTSALEKAMYELLKIEHRTTSPYWPKANMAQERQNKELAHFIRTVLHEAQKSSVHWELYLPALQLSINTAVNKAIRMAPFKAMFGYDARLPLYADLDILQQGQFDLPPNDKDAFFQWGDTLRATRQIAHANNRHFLDQQAHQPDTTMNSFQAKQDVWVKILPVRDQNKKFVPKWEPAIIMERTGPTTYKIKRIMTKHKKITVLNAAHIKPRTPSVFLEEEEEQFKDPDPIVDHKVPAFPFPPKDLHDEMYSQNISAWRQHISAITFRDARGYVYNLDQWIGRKMDHSPAEIMHILNRLEMDNDPNDYSLCLRRNQSLPQRIPHGPQHQPQPPPPASPQPLPHEVPAQEQEDNAAYPPTPPTPQATAHDPFLTPASSELSTGSFLRQGPSRLPSQQQPGPSVARRLSFSSTTPPSTPQPTRTTSTPSQETVITPLTPPHIARKIPAKKPTLIQKSIDARAAQKYEEARLFAWKEHYKKVQSHKPPNLSSSQQTNQWQEHCKALFNAVNPPPAAFYPSDYLKKSAPPRSPTALERHYAQKLFDAQPNLPSLESVRDVKAFYKS